MIQRLWKKIPILVRAILLGSLVFLTMQLGQLLLIVNAENNPGFAWSVPLVLLFLFGSWKYFSGAGWPARSAEARRRSMRVDETTFHRPLSYAAALAILVHLVGLAVVTSAIIPFPEQSFRPPAFLGSLGVGTAFPIIVAFALVAGVSEESGFRGYMQVPLEKRYGATVAILITAVLFWLAHYSHASFMHRAPILLGSGLFLGALSYLSCSLWPAILVHFAADTIGFTSICGYFGFPRLYRSETIWDTGIHGGFVAALVVALLGGLLAVVILRRMALHPGRVA